MKNILFVIPAFTVGGTNTSLISLLPYIDREKYKVSVYAMNPSGPMGYEIAKYGTVINKLGEAAAENTAAGSKALTRTVLKAIKKCLGFIGVDLTPIYYRKQVRELSKTPYDCVIAFQEGEATRFVQYFKNVRKAAWVRSDYSRFLSITNSKPEKDLYREFDIIVNVSENALHSFLHVMPDFKEQSIFIYNLVNSERIINLSKIDSEHSFPLSEFIIVSLGRIDKVKHFSEIPGIALKLKKHGIIFRWHIIGGATVRYPEEYEALKKCIENYELQNQVILLGHQPNPYPLLARSNILVCLSESETFNHTFAEARTLGVPVLSVNYPGAEEILGHNNGGLITTRDSISETLENLISDKALYNRLKQQAGAFSYDNQAQLDKLYDLVFER